MVYADKIMRVEFRLENCEFVSIEREHIGHMFIGEFERQITRQAYNYIEDMVIANKVIIEINVNANEKCLSSHRLEGCKPFDRLMAWNDITHIAIISSNGNEEVFAVNYDEGDNKGVLGANNINQKTKTNNFGDLYIVIGENLDIDEEFPDEDINDNEVVILCGVCMAYEEK